MFGKIHKGERTGRVHYGKPCVRFIVPTIPRMSCLTPDCVKTLSEPFDRAQGERISTQFLTMPHRSW